MLLNQRIMDLGVSENGISLPNGTFNIIYIYSILYTNENAGLPVDSPDLGVPSCLKLVFNWLVLGKSYFWDGWLNHKGRE